MSSPQTPASSPDSSSLFGSAAPRPGPPALLPWAAAALLIVLAAGGALLVGRHRQAVPEHSQAQDGYGTKLVFSDLQMSESTSLSGGKSTFIDGHVRNQGDATVSAATLQVTFANDEAMPPQVQTLPLTLIRTREPYVDTQPVEAAPLTPGSDREFRLIFESVGSNWNQQLPAIRAVRVFTTCNPCA